MLWRWCKRRHPNKPAKWVKNKYFIREGGRNWVFGCKEKGKTVKLTKASDTPIIRHVKIKADANPYDPTWEEYFEKRQFSLMKQELWNKKLSSLFVRQKGQCAQCHQPITQETGWNAHHIVPRVEGGKDTLNNLSLLHPNCHRQHHSLKAAGS